VPGSRILATAPSNFAADVIAERLARFGIDTDAMFRLNALTRRGDRLPSSLVAFSCTGESGSDVPPISQLLKYRIIVSTCISSSLLFATGAPRGHFDYIFVDEAGYALEPEALVPILTIADESTRVVLSGDPKQLGPIVHSACASSFGFGKSFLERLMGTVAYSRSFENPLCVL
jgi:helicase MOV-10